MNSPFQMSKEERSEIISNTETDTKNETYKKAISQESVNETCSNFESDIMNKLFDNHCLDKSTSPVKTSSSPSRVRLVRSPTIQKPPSKHGLKTYSCNKNLKLKKDTLLKSSNSVNKPVTSIVLPPTSTHIKVVDTKGNLIAKPPSSLKADPETLAVLKRLHLLPSLRPMNTSTIATITICNPGTTNTVVSSSTSSQDNLKSGLDLNKSVNQRTEIATNKTEVSINTDRNDVISLNMTSKPLDQVPYHSKQQCKPSTSQEFDKSEEESKRRSEDECNDHVARLKSKVKQCNVILACKEWERDLEHNIRASQSNPDCNQIDQSDGQNNTNFIYETANLQTYQNEDNNLKTYEEITSVDNKDNQKDMKNYESQYEIECQQKKEVAQYSMPEELRISESHEDFNNQEIKVIRKNKEQIENLCATEKCNHNFKRKLHNQDVSQSEEALVDPILPKAELPAQIVDNTKARSRKASEIEEKLKENPTDQSKLRRSKRKSLESIKNISVPKNEKKTSTKEFEKLKVKISRERIQKTTVMSGNMSSYQGEKKDNTEDAGVNAANIKSDKLKTLETKNVCEKPQKLRRSKRKGLEKTSESTKRKEIQVKVLNNKIADSLEKESCYEDSLISEVIMCVNENNSESQPSENLKVDHLGEKNSQRNNYRKRNSKCNEKIICELKMGGDSPFVLHVDNKESLGSPEPNINNTSLVNQHHESTEDEPILINIVEVGSKSQTSIPELSERVELDGHKELSKTVGVISEEFSKEMSVTSERREINTNDSLSSSEQKQQDPSYNFNLVCDQAGDRKTCKKNEIKIESLFKHNHPDVLDRDHESDVIQGKIDVSKNNHDYKTNQIKGVSCTEQYKIESFGPPINEETEPTLENKPKIRGIVEGSDEIVNVTHAEELSTVKFRLKYEQGRKTETCDKEKSKCQETMGDVIESVEAIQKFMDEFSSPCKQTGVNVGLDEMASPPKMESNSRKVIEKKNNIDNLKSNHRVIRRRKKKKGVSRKRVSNINVSIPIENLDQEEIKFLSPNLDSCIGTSIKTTPDIGLLSPRNVEFPSKSNELPLKIPCEKSQHGLSEEFCFKEDLYKHHILSKNLESKNKLVKSEFNEIPSECDIENFDIRENKLSSTEILSNYKEEETTAKHEVVEKEENVEENSSKSEQVEDNDEQKIEDFSRPEEVEEATEQKEEESSAKSEEVDNNAMKICDEFKEKKENLLKCEDPEKTEEENMDDTPFKNQELEDNSIKPAQESYATPEELEDTTKEQGVKESYVTPEELEDDTTKEQEVKESYATPEELEDTTKEQEVKESYATPEELEDTTKEQEVKESYATPEELEDTTKEQEVKESYATPEELEDTTKEQEVKESYVTPEELEDDTTKEQELEETYATPEEIEETTQEQEVEKTNATPENLEVTTKKQEVKETTDKQEVEETNKEQGVEAAYSTPEETEDSTKEHEVENAYGTPEHLEETTAVEPKEVEETKKQFEESSVKCDEVDNTYENPEDVEGTREQEVEATCAIPEEVEWNCIKLEEIKENFTESELVGEMKTDYVEETKEKGLDETSAKSEKVEENSSKHEEEKDTSATPEEEENSSKHKEVLDNSATVEEVEETPEIEKVDDTKKQVEESCVNSEEVEETCSKPKEVEETFATPEKVEDTKKQEVEETEEQKVEENSATPEEENETSTQPQEVKETYATPEEVEETYATPDQVEDTKKQEVEETEEQKVEENSASLEEVVITKRRIKENSATPEEVVITKEESVEENSASPEEVEENSAPPEEVEKTKEQEVEDNKKQDVDENSDTPEEVEENSSTPEEIDKTKEQEIKETSTEPVQVSETSVTPEEVGDTSVTPEEVGETSVTPEEVEETSATPEEVGETSVTPEEVEETSVTPEEVGETSVTPEEVGETSVTPEEVGETSVTPEEVEETSVTPEEVGETSVTPEEVEETSVTPEEVGETSVTPEEVGETSVTPEEVEETSVAPEEVDETSVRPEEVEDTSATPEEVKEVEETSDKPQEVVQSSQEEVEETAPKHQEVDENSQEEVEETAPKHQEVDENSQEEVEKTAPKHQEVDENSQEEVEETAPKHQEEVDENSQEEVEKTAHKHQEVDENSQEEVEETAPKHQKVDENSQEEVEETAPKHQKVDENSQEEVEETAPKHQEVDENSQEEEVEENSREEVEETSTKTREVDDNSQEKVDEISAKPVKGKSFVDNSNKVGAVEENLSQQKVEETEKHNVEETSVKSEEVEYSFDRAESVEDTNDEKAGKFSDKPEEVKNEQTASESKILYDEKVKKLKIKENNVECVVELNDKIQENSTSDVKQYMDTKTNRLSNNIAIEKVKRKIGPKSKVKHLLVEEKDDDEDGEIVAPPDFKITSQANVEVKVKKLCPKSKKYVFNVNDPNASAHSTKDETRDVPKEEIEKQIIYKETESEPKFVFENETQLINLLKVEHINPNGIEIDASENENVDYVLSSSECMNNNVEIKPDITASENVKTEFHEKSEEQNASEINLELEIPEFSVKKDTVASKTNVFRENTTELDPNFESLNNPKCVLKTKINIKNMSIVKNENEEEDTSEHLETYGIKNCFVNLDLIEMEGNSISGASLNKLVKKSKDNSHRVTVRRKENLRRHHEFERYAAQHVKHEVMSDSDMFNPSYDSVYSDDSKYFTTVRLRNKEITKYVNVVASESSETSESEDGYSLCSDGSEEPFTSEPSDESEDNENEDLEHDIEYITTARVSLVNIDHLITDNSSIKLTKDTLEKLDCKIMNLEQIIDNNIQIADKENVVNTTNKIITTPQEFVEKKKTLDKEIAGLLQKASKPALQNTHASSFETNRYGCPESKPTNQSLRKTENQESSRTNPKSRLLITPSEKVKLMNIGMPLAEVSDSLSVTPKTLGKSVSISLIKKSEWDKYNNGSRSIADLPGNCTKPLTFNPKKQLVNIKPNNTEGGTRLVNFQPSSIKPPVLKRKVSITPLQSREVPSSSTLASNKPHPHTVASDKTDAHPPPANDKPKSLAEFISMTKAKGNMIGLKPPRPTTVKETNNSAHIAKDILKSCTQKTPAKPRVPNITINPLIKSMKNVTVTPVIKNALERKVGRPPTYEKPKFVNTTLTKATANVSLLKTNPTANIPQAKLLKPPLKTRIINENIPNAHKTNIVPNDVKLSDTTSSNNELSGILSEIGQIETFSEGSKEFADLSNDLMKDQKISLDTKQSHLNTSVKYTDKMTLNQYSFPTTLKPTSSLETLTSNFNLGVNGATLQTSFSYDQQVALEDLFPDSVLNSQLFRTNQSGDEFTLQEDVSLNLQSTTPISNMDSTTPLSNMVSGYSTYDIASENRTTPVQYNTIIPTSCEENITSVPTLATPSDGNIFGKTSLELNQTRSDGIIKSPISNVTQALRAVRPVKILHDKTVPTPGSADPNQSLSSQPPLKVSSQNIGNSQQSVVISSSSCVQVPSHPLPCPSLAPLNNTLSLTASTSLRNMSSGSLTSGFPTYVNVVAPDGVSTPLVSMNHPNCSVQVSSTPSYSQPFIDIVSEATELLAPSIPNQDIMLTDPSYQQMPSPGQHLLITSTPNQLSVSPNTSQMFTPNSSHQQILSPHSDQNSFIPCTSNVQIAIPNNLNQFVSIPNQQLSIPINPSQQSILTTNQLVPIRNQQLLASPSPNSQQQNCMVYDDPVFVPGQSDQCFDHSTSNTTIISDSISPALESTIPAVLGSNIPSLETSCSGVNNSFDNYTAQTPDTVSPSKDPRFSHEEQSNALFQPMTSWPDTPLSEIIDNTEIDHSGGTPKRKRRSSNQKSPRKSNRKSPCVCNSSSCYDSIIDSVLSNYTNNTISHPCSHVNDVEAPPTSYDIQASATLPPMTPPTPLPPIQSLNSHLPVFQVPSSSCSGLEPSVDIGFTSPNVSLNSSGNEGLCNFPSYTSDSSQNNSFSQMSVSNNSETEKPESLLDGNYAGAEFQNLTEWILRDYFEIQKDPQEESNLLDSFVLNTTPTTVSSIETISSQLEASCEANSQQNFLLNLPSTSGQNSTNPSPNQSLTDPSKQSLESEVPQEVMNPTVRVYQILDAKSKQNKEWNHLGLLGPTSFRSALGLLNGQHRRREPVNNQQSSSDKVPVVLNKDANSQQYCKTKDYPMKAIRMPQAVPVAVKRKSLEKNLDQMKKLKVETHSNVNLVTENVVGDSSSINKTITVNIGDLNTKNEVHLNQKSFTSEFTNKTPTSLLTADQYKTVSNKIISSENLTSSAPPLNIVPKPCAVTNEKLVSDEIATSIAQENTRQISNSSSVSKTKTLIEMPVNESTLITNSQNPTSVVNYQLISNSKPIYSEPSQSKPHLTLKRTTNLDFTIPESTPPPSPLVKIGTKSVVTPVVNIQKTLSEAGKIPEKYVAKQNENQKSLPEPKKIQSQPTPSEKSHSKSAVSLDKEHPVLKSDKFLMQPMEPLEKTSHSDESQSTVETQEKSTSPTKARRSSGVKNSEAPLKTQEKPGPSGKTLAESSNSKRKLSKQDDKRQTCKVKHDMNSIIEQQLKTVKKFCSEKNIKQYILPMKVSNYEPSTSLDKTDAKPKPFQDGDYCIKSQDLFKVGPSPSLWQVYPSKKNITEFVYGVVSKKDEGKYNFVFKANATIGNFLSVDTNLWIKVYFYKDVNGVRFDQVKNEQALEKFITDKSFMTTERIRGTFEVYLQVIISQALNSDFLTYIELMCRNNSSFHFFRPWNEINEMLKRYTKTMNRCFLCYDERIVEALIQYPFCVVEQGEQCDVPDNVICPLCDKTMCTVKIVLRGPFYDRKNLASLDNHEDKKEFHLCEECAHFCVLFSRVLHFNYLVFQLVLNMVKPEFPSAFSSSKNASLNDAYSKEKNTPLNESVLSNKKFYDDIFLWFQTLLSYIDYCEYFIISGPSIFRRRLKRKPDDFVCEVAFEKASKDVKDDGDKTKNDLVCEVAFEKASKDVKDDGDKTKNDLVCEVAFEKASKDVKDDGDKTKNDLVCEVPFEKASKDVKDDGDKTKNDLVCEVAFEKASKDVKDDGDKTKNDLVCEVAFEKTSKDVKDDGDKTKNESVETSKADFSHMKSEPVGKTDNTENNPKLGDDNTSLSQSDTVPTDTLEQSVSKLGDTQANEETTEVVIENTSSLAVNLENVKTTEKYTNATELSENQTYSTSGSIQHENKSNDNKRVQSSHPAKAGPLDNKNDRLRVTGKSIDNCKVVETNSEQQTDHKQEDGGEIQAEIIEIKGNPTTWGRSLEQAEKKTKPRDKVKNETRNKRKSDFETNKSKGKDNLKKLKIEIEDTRLSDASKEKCKSKSGSNLSSLKETSKIGRPRKLENKSKPKIGDQLKTKIENKVKSQIENKIKEKSMHKPAIKTEKNDMIKEQPKSKSEHVSNHTGGHKPKYKTLPDKPKHKSRYLRSSTDKRNMNETTELKRKDEGKRSSDKSEAKNNVKKVPKVIEKSKSKGNFDIDDDITNMIRTHVVKKGDKQIKRKETVK
ncbi:hypothetical protein WDU94_001062 [Cyamophila willieti]